MNFSRIDRTRREFLSGLAAGLAGLGAAGKLYSQEQRGRRDDPRREPREIPVSGHEHVELAAYDRLMTAFMREHRTPGASLAVMKDGRLVYARGFGNADRASDSAVEPNALFRIASLSKPITAIGILRLAEQGKFKLSDKAFALLDFEPHREQGVTPDARLADVTVLHLLQHTGGWDRGVSYDAMFRPVEIAKSLDVEPPAMQTHIIRYMLGQPLDFNPGERYAYSNFGYCVLGRIVEKFTGRTYDQYIREEVLAKCGIQEMRLGRSLEEHRAPNEVKYYQRGADVSVFAHDLGEQAPLPYGTFNLEAMDSHGGWLSSAADLLRLCRGLDGDTLISCDMKTTLAACPAGPAGHEQDGREKDIFYGCGWSIRPGRIGRRAHMNHAGSLSGTSTLLVRRDDGIAWAILFNTRNGRQRKALSTLIDEPLHQIANDVKTWPQHDLFDKAL